MKTRDLKDRIISVLEVEHLVSANSLIDKLSTTDTTYNKSSVYRALDQLVETGTACEHNFSGKETLYELSSHHHSHLYCSSCGTVSTGPCEYTQPKKIGDFTVNHHHITLIGMCSDCQSS